MSTEPVTHLELLVHLNKGLTHLVNAMKVFSECHFLDDDMIDIDVMRIYHKLVSKMSELTVPKNESDG